MRSLIPAPVLELHSLCYILPIAIAGLENRISGRYRVRNGEAHCQACDQQYIVLIAGHLIYAVLNYCAKHKPLLDRCPRT